MLTAAVALALSLAAQDPPSQDPPVQDPTSQESTVEGIVVEGRRLDDAIRDYVTSVAAPSRGRGLATWRRDLCIGVANLSAEPAQYLIDRIASVADELGVGVGEPGCDANVMIIFAADAAGTARGLIEKDRAIFRLGVGGLDRGNSALERFRDSDAPVRWWQTSIPIDADTGQRAVRLPGDIDPSTGRPAAPIISVMSSRLSTEIRDDLTRTIVIVDVDDIAGASFEQVADYLAMVTLAQVDPEGSTQGFTTVLNVFDDPESTPGLSEWDWAYLQALYGSRPQRLGRNAVAADLARTIARDRRSDAADEAAD